MDGKIYVVKNDLNDLVYVGQTIRDVSERFKEHRHPGMAKKELLAKAMQELGREHFYFEVLETGIQTQRELNYREAFYVSTMRTVWPDGYNLTLGGTWGRELKSTKTPPRQEFVLAYQQGYSLSEIADQYGVCNVTVLKHLRKAGVQMRSPGSRPGECNVWEHTRHQKKIVETSR